jgi:hypothetical protein
VWGIPKNLVSEERGSSDADSERAAELPDSKRPKARSRGHRSHRSTKVVCVDKRVDNLRSWSS